MAMARFGPCLYSVSCVLAPPYHFFGPLIKVVSAQAGSIEEGIAQSRAGLSTHRGPLNQAQAAAPPRRPHAPAAAPCSSCAPSPSCSRPHPCRIAALAAILSNRDARPQGTPRCCRRQEAQSAWLAGLV
jgi:hypothetical protein